MLPCLFWGRCQIPRLGVSCSSGAAFRVCCFLRFLGGDAKSLAWVFLARRVLPFVLGFFCCLFWGAMPNPSLGCFLLVGCCLSRGGSFLAFFGGDAKSLAWVFLARRVLTKWMVMGSVYLELFVLVAMEHHFVVPKCPKSVKISPSSQVLPCLFWGRCQIPRLGVSCSSGAAFRVCFFWRFLGGDAKSLAWVFLARRVLPFVLGFFCCLSWGRCQIPRLGVSCSSGAAFRVWVLFLPFLGAAKSLAWVFLARRVLTKWMVMGSVYLELFQTKPCCILVCPIIPYVLWNTIL